MPAYYVFQPRTDGIPAGAKWDAYLKMQDNSPDAATVVQYVQNGYLILGWRVEANDLEDVFEAANYMRDEYDERECQTYGQARSMSVGDIAVYVGENGWKASRCASVGWEDLEYDDQVCSAMMRHMNFN